MALTSFSVCESQAIPAHSRIGQTGALCAVSFVFFFPILWLRLISWKCLIGFVGAATDVDTPFHTVLNFDTKVML